MGEKNAEHSPLVHHGSQLLPRPHRGPPGPVQLRDCVEQDVGCCEVYQARDQEEERFLPVREEDRQEIGPQGLLDCARDRTTCCGEARLGSKYSLGTYGGKDFAKVMLSTSAAADVTTDVDAAVAHAVASGTLPTGDTTFKTEINCICPNYWEIPPGKKSYIKVEVTAVNAATAGDRKAATDIQLGAWDAISVDAKGYCTDAAKTAVETLAKAKMTGISTGISVSISGCTATTASDAD